MKKALLVGINYVGQNSELNGCYNDICNMKELLLKNYGFDEVTLLTDLDETFIQPTRANILLYLKYWLFSGNEPGDTLYFHYSGHGSKQRDHDYDEVDGFDEVIIPVDYNTAGVITDDTIRDVIEEHLGECKLYSVMDCCHSGTILDLKHTYLNNSIYDDNSNLLLGIFKHTINPKYASTKNIYMISGCLDHQTSADAYIDGTYQGALTSNLIDILKENNCEVTFYKLICQLKLRLFKNEYSQIPQLGSSKYINIRSERFIN